MGKKKNKDFQKVKLKVGRRISRGNNVTDTKFKSKKIVLLDQLKEYEGRPEDKVKYDILELIKRLDFNVSRKISSLCKLKELVNSHNDLAVANVCNLTRKVCALVADKDVEVRKEALNLLNCLFVCVSEKQMSSLFPVLRTYILNATTHLDKNVRNDSLKFLDLVLDFYPQALCNSMSIFNAFLDLISSVKYSQSKSPAKRQLTSTPKEKITAQEWRVKVLQRLLKFLDANVNLLQSTDSECPQAVSFDTTIYSMAIQRHFTIDPEYICGIQRSKTFKDDSCDTDGVFLQGFIGQVMALLFEAWQEAVPSSNLNKSFGDTLTHESIAIMMIIVQVICSINEWVVLLCKENLSREFLGEFKERYSKTFQSIFLPKFPYDIAEGPNVSQKKWRMGMQEKVSSLTMNLAICKVFAIMVMDTHCMALSENMILSYLLQVSHLETLDFTNLTSLLSTLKLFFSISEHPSDLESHLEGVFLLYQKTRNDDVRKDVGNFFASLALDPIYYAHNESRTLELFLEHLMEVFLAAVDEETIDEEFLSTIKKIANRGFASFISSLETNADVVISLIRHEDEKVQDISAFLVPKVHNFTPELFYKLATTLHESPSILCKMIDIFSMFNYRVCCDRNLGFRIEDYYSFLFNIMVVNDTDEHKTSSIFPMMRQHAPNNLFMYTIVPTAEWETHKKIVDAAMTTLSQLPDRRIICQCIQRFLELFLVNTLEITTHSVHAIFQLYNMSAYVEYEKGNLEIFISNLILSSCLYETALRGLDMSKENHLRYSLLGALPTVKKNFLELVKNFVDSIRSHTHVECIKYTKTVFRQLVTVINDNNFYAAVMHIIKDLYGNKLNDAWVREILIQASPTSLVNTTP